MSLSTLPSVPWSGTVADITRPSVGGLRCEVNVVVWFRLWWLRVLTDYSRPVIGSNLFVHIRISAFLQIFLMQSHGLQNGTQGHTYGPDLEGAQLSIIWIWAVGESEHVYSLPVSSCPTTPIPIGKSIERAKPLELVVLPCIIQGLTRPPDPCSAATNADALQPPLRTTATPSEKTTGLSCLALMVVGRSTSQILHKAISLLGGGRIPPELQRTVGHFDIRTVDQPFVNSFCIIKIIHSQSSRCRLPSTN